MDRTTIYPHQSREAVLENFLRHFDHARRSGAEWKAKCPAHPDRDPSLSFTQADDGRILLHCHAGCSPEAIVEALGLTMADLFPDGGSSAPRIVATYNYTDETGQLLYQVVRKEPKGFSQRRPDGKDGWIWNLDGVRRVLYNLPHVIAEQEEVFVAEGEKDADRLMSLGLTATTNPGGAGKWLPDFSKYFRGKQVIVLPDNDAPGQFHAGDVANKLSPVAASVKIIDLPGLPEKGDVSDWLDAGHTNEELLQVVSEAPEYLPDDAVDDGPAPPSNNEQQKGISVNWPAPMAPEALYGLAGDFVRLVAPESEADPAALLTQFLVGAGAFLGREGAYFQVEKTRHYPNLYTITVGPTASGRKGTASGHVLDVLDQAEENFRRDHVITGLSSGEGLIHAAGGSSDKRFLAFLPELASLLGVMRREGSTLSAVIREGWDGGRMQVATRKNPLKVDSVHLSVIAHITPGELLNSLTETDRVNGFANRFLLSCARRSKLLPDGGADTDTSSIVKGLVQARQAALKIRRVRRDAQASALWHSVYEHLTEERQGLFGAITSRAAAQVARLSLLYALLDRATEIRVEHLKAALAVWDYCERSAAYLFGSATGDPDANKILDALKGGQKTMKELHRLFGNNRDGGWLRAKLGQLAAMGKVEMDRIGTDGRTGEAWKLR